MQGSGGGGEERGGRTQGATFVTFDFACWTGSVRPPDMAVGALTAFALKLELETVPLLLLSSLPVNPTFN